MHGFKSYFPSSLYTPTAASAVADAKRGAAPFAAPVAGFAPSNFQHPAAGFMAASSQEYGIDYFLKGALAGGICCSVTHGALTPVDVVKTRMQLDPSKYTGMVSGFNKVIAEEGAGALLTGLGPTAFGYFVQGWFKFGGVEYFKIQAHNSMTPQQTWDNRNSIYLGASAAAEFIADIFLCPLEATRIRLVSNPTYASSMSAPCPRWRRGGRHRRLLLRLRSHPRQAGALHHGQVRRARHRGGADLRIHRQNPQDVLAG
jgi:solute carrier family 25 phosphate transporter 3